MNTAIEQQATLQQKIPPELQPFIEPGFPLSKTITNKRNQTQTFSLLYLTFPNKTMVLLHTSTKKRTVSFRYGLKENYKNLFLAHSKPAKSLLQALIETQELAFKTNPPIGEQR